MKIFYYLDDLEKHIWNSKFIPNLGDQVILNNQDLVVTDRCFNYNNNTLAIVLK